MRAQTSLSALVALALSASTLAVNVARVASPAPAAVSGKRTKSLLKTAAGQPPVPAAASVAQTIGNISTDDIQGDILIGMKKQNEVFLFFGITDVATFKSKLASDIAPTITSTTQLLSVGSQPQAALNIAFSASGLAILNVSGTIPPATDAPFLEGQTAAAAALGDPGTTNWVPQFVGTTIHGVFLIASDTQSLVDQQVASLQNTLGSSITTLYSLEGNIRPGAEAGHEHFGFLDGIAQPAVTGFGTPLPGQLVVDPGVILVGGTNDGSGNPAWMAGGAFLAFRQLAQKVPEFDAFLLNNAFPTDNLTAQEAAELLGARMVGRWKSGAPVDLAPLADDPALGADPQRNNNFNFSHPGFDEATDQTHCPFSAHIRKTHPRADLTAPTHSIIRAGIPYGPEVSADEAAANTTSTERGLAFVAYQSQIAQGFQFLQKTWANNVNFIFGKATPPGFDPIIGANAGAARNASGMDIADPTAELTMSFDFVVSRGGEYFFSPPISAITNVLAA